MKANEEFIAWTELEPMLKKIEQAIASDDIVSLRSILNKLRLGYTADEQIVDWLHLENKPA